jgi:hypothetical protein
MEGVEAEQSADGLTWTCCGASIAAKSRLDYLNHYQNRPAGIPDGE